MGHNVPMFALLVLLLVLSTAQPVLAYSAGSGNDNAWISTAVLECRNGLYSHAHMGVAWVVANPVLSSDDAQGVTGQWTWQEVQTEQSLTKTENGVAYQYFQNVHDYELTDPWIEVLLPAAPHYYGEGGLVSWTSLNNYYVGGASASQKIEVEADAIWSNNVITGVNFYVWDNGVLQNNSAPITVDFQSTYYATPIAYQNVLASYEAVNGVSYTPVTFAGGSGIFYTFSDYSQYNVGTNGNGPCYGWNTVESSNMGYYAFPGSCTDCDQNYTVANESPFIEVQSVNQSGNLIYGYYTELDNINHAKIASGFTTYTFSDTYVVNGTSYYLRADSYGSCTFNHWSDGITTDPRLVIVSDQTRYTAVYDCT